MPNTRRLANTRAPQSRVSLSWVARQSFAPIIEFGAALLSMPALTIMHIFNKPALPSFRCQTSAGDGRGYLLKRSFIF